MTTIERFFTKSAVVLRMAEGEEDGHYIQQESEVGTVAGHLQQADAELVAQLGLSLTQAFTFWCGVSEDIQEGDKLRIESVLYGVKAVMRVDASPRNPHLEIVLEYINRNAGS